MMGHINKVSCFFTVLLCTVFTQQFSSIDDKNPTKVKILQYENNMEPNSYNFEYKTSDGSYRQERAQLKNVGSKEATMVVEGSYQYVGNDGNTYPVNYVADENGYRASGVHLPNN